jgi:hypothetical protein
MRRFDAILGPMTSLVKRQPLLEVVVAAAAMPDERSDAIARSTSTV